MTNEYQEKWFATAPGRFTDPDGVAGYQCVDAAKDYFMAIFGVSWWKGWPGAGNAKDMLGTIDPEYFDVIWNDVNDPNLIPQRGDIVVWGGTPDWGVNPYGHIAVVLSADANGVTVIQQDGGLQCAMFVGTLAYYLPTAGTVIGWLRPKFDAPAAPAPAAPAANQRLVGQFNVNQRDAAATSGKVIRTIAAGTTETWDGFVHGEAVTVGGLTSDVWFKDSAGYAWSGGFEDSSTNGLVDLTPATEKPLAPFQRVTGEHGAILRAAPDKNADAVQTFVPDRVLDFKGYVHGTQPYGDGNDIWFVGKTSGQYVYSGALTDPSTAGLSDLTPAPATPAPVPAPAPVVKAYDFKLDFIQIGTVKVEKIPADIGNVDVGNFPASPGTAVCHWWNKLEVHPAIEGVIARFQQAGAFVSAHFVVDEDRIVQMVSLKDRAYHARESNGWVGIEINPAATERNADGSFTARALKIQKNVRDLLAALKSRYGAELALSLHKNAPGNIGKTECSGLDLAWFSLSGPVPGPVAPAPAPVTPTPVPGPEAATEAQRRAAVEELLAALLDLFFPTTKGK